MPQCPFIFGREISGEINPFPHIDEFGLKSNNSVILDSFEITKSKNLCIYSVIDGKFEWIIDGKSETLFPGDSAIVLPGQEIGGNHGYFGIGTTFWLHLNIKIIDPEIGILLGKWSRLKKNERQIIGKILVNNKIPVIRAGNFEKLFREMYEEISNQEIGFVTRVNNLLDTFLIFISRQITRQSVSRRDFPQTFANLEQALRKNLSHKWTVEEMAAMAGLGTTAFTEKVRTYTGFTPLHYLINVRISEAIKLLKSKDANITDIALYTGFYSSQHFSTTFKKLTGHSPNEFRKKNTSN